MKTKLLTLIALASLLVLSACASRPAAPTPATKAAPHATHK